MRACRSLRSPRGVLASRVPSAQLQCTRRAATTSSTAVTLDLDAAALGAQAGVAVLTLCRPEARNALSSASLAELGAACAKLEAAAPGAVRAVVVRSSVDKVRNTA